MVRVIVQLFSKNVILFIKKYLRRHTFIYIALQYLIFFKTNHVKRNRCNVEYNNIDYNTGWFNTFQWITIGWSCLV